MAQKSFPNALRTKLGITLEKFAELIACNAGQLSMAESGKRNLSSESLIQTDILAQSLAEAEEDNTDFLGNDAMQALCLKHIEAAKLKKMNLDYVLEKATLEAETLVLFLKTAKKWQAITATFALDEQKLVMQILERKALRKWKKINASIYQYRITLAGLSAEIAEAESIIKNEK